MSAQAFALQLSKFFPEANAHGRAQFAQWARDVNAEILAAAAARDGVAPDMARSVNGRMGAAEEEVRLPGPILYLYDYRRAQAEWILAELRRRSAVVTGRYRASHAVFLDGVRVAALPRPLPRAEIWIANTTPYARRLESGYADAGGWFAQRQEAKLYEAVAVAADRRFPGLAKTGFIYAELPGAYVVKGARTRAAAQNRRSSAFRAGRTRLPDRNAGKPVTTPTIVIYPQAL